MDELNFIVKPERSSCCERQTVYCKAIKRSLCLILHFACLTSSTEVLSSPIRLAQGRTTDCFNRNPHFESEERVNK